MEFMIVMSPSESTLKSTELASRILFQGTAELLSAHLKGASIKEELGVCVDNVCLDFIPPTWPFLFQTCMVGKLLDDVYPLLSNPVSLSSLDRRVASEVLPGVSRGIAPPESLAFQGHKVPR